MGLTIHYGLASRTRSTERAKALVEQMRQLALDLPFESVDDKVQHLGPDVCQRPLDELRPDETLFSTVLDGCKHVSIPWHRKQSASVTVQPLEILSFWTVPGPGSEWASFGLARYPAEIEVTYCPGTTTASSRPSRDGCSTRWQFDWKRWERWLRVQRPRPLGVSRGREVPRETEGQDRSRLQLAVLELLQDPVCKRRQSAAASPTSSAATCASSTCSTGSPNCRR